MRISDWSSDVCSSDLPERPARRPVEARAVRVAREHHRLEVAAEQQRVHQQREDRRADPGDEQQDIDGQREEIAADRSEEHTSELQSLMRISYAVFCLKKKKHKKTKDNNKLAHTQIQPNQ